ncbi:hypothetical protein FS749_008659 [Ceratobasidium sp. UAMH 11750]|nr:hypothetical protein FS749_008659 [Ceratobasidium sp. UAMH 11750]
MMFWIVVEGSSTLTEDAYMQVRFTTTPPRHDTHVIPARTVVCVAQHPIWRVVHTLSYRLASRCRFTAVIVVQPEVVRKFQIPAKSSDLCKHRPPGQGISSTSLGRREARSGMRRYWERLHERRFSHDLSAHILKVYLKASLLGLMFVFRVTVSSSFGANSIDTQAHKRFAARDQIGLQWLRRAI